jgi:hypothetical protein
MAKAIHVFSSRIVARRSRVDNPADKRPSQRLRAITAADLIVVCFVVWLFFEIPKETRFSRRPRSVSKCRGAVLSSSIHALASRNAIDRQLERRRQSCGSGCWESGGLWHNCKLFCLARDCTGSAYHHRATTCVRDNLIL